MNVVATAVLTIVLLAPGAAKPLDGLRFSGETGEKGKKGEKEDFEFKDGKFDPLECHRFGFAATEYTAKTEGDHVAFEAEHKNAKGERMRWVGTVKGDALEGKMTYFDAKGTPSEYWFKAKKTKS